ncbi:MAG TPA: thermonuclease family protein [Thermomicrobiales bacterium]|nr:thermonuclease family protein [Thermomicrobiales bacterium]
MGRYFSFVLAAIVLMLSFGLVSADNPAGIPKDAVQVTLIRVVDGDTIHVRMPDGADEPLRLIGIDSPETVDPEREIGCFGPEASAHLEKLIKPGRSLWIETDQSNRDRFDRLLRYVWVQKSSGGVYLLNEVLVRDGYAQAKRYPPDIKRSEQLEAAQELAQRKGRGMWSACPGLIGTVAPTAKATAQPIGILSGGNCDPSYPTLCIPIGSPDLDCPDIPDRRFPVTGADPMRFDRDRDGIGCEGG